METEKIVVTRNTQIKDMLEFMNMSFEQFYCDCIADNINRADYWRKYANDGNESFEIIKK